MLSSGSVLNYDLGTPGVVGSGVNDLVSITGDLTLDGTLNVTDAGGFGLGVYTVMTYGGALTDNGLALGTLPASFDYQVQTGAGEVNLVVGGSAGGPTQFWDGTNNTSNGVINGGSGVWTAAPTNWTNLDGTSNAAWGGLFAVFQATAGTVTVEGTVDFIGMQFRTTGYRIVAGAGGLLNTDDPAALLRVDPGVTAEISAPITGTGGLVKQDGGTLILSGDNSYAGATALLTGRLLVNGTVSSDVGAAGGTTLGGNGSITGDVTLAPGAILAPGGSPGAVGTLTVGSLTLSPGSVLEYDLGRPGIVGSGENDLVDVTGNLTLNGTLNVADVGGFGLGVYTVMTYGAVLDDNGLSLGSLPGSFNFHVQTGGGEVNLIVGGNSGGPTQFWDGSHMVANGVVDGGSGTWTAGPTNWTNAEGDFNGDWRGLFAVFQGEAGTVTVEGEVGFIGMQFRTDAYRILGGAQGVLNTDEAATRLRVDSEVTAEISAPIAGTGRLVKEDAGTLVLAGENSYTGGTQLNAGVLSVSSDANLGAPTGDLVFRGGTLRTTADLSSSRTTTLISGGGTVETVEGTTFDLAGTIGGAGSMRKTGEGTLVLSGKNTYTGGTRFDAGTVSISEDSNLGNPSGVLTFDAGTLQTTQDISSERTTTLNSGGGTIGTVATTTFSFAGNIGGAGRLNKAGGGTLILTGANTYRGGTAIDAGTLQIGDGGTTGSILGDVDNSGTLVFNRSNDFVFAGVISGAGNLVIEGAGALTLSGTSNYTGPTSLNAGTLFVNGMLGDTTVQAASATTLGGSGSIDGNVNLTSGATLAPGATPGAAGTLTVGSLALSAGSILNYDLGPPDVTGGGVNDLVVVNGGLTLDGTLNVADAGGFGLGVYTLMTYGDMLTDNGLELGTLPEGFDHQVRSGDGEVNLVVGGTSGGPTQFWDGNNTTANALIDGGSGAWTTDPTNWTDLDGNFNRAWGGQFAVFQGTAGTVTVEGTVDFIGMQFRTDGYKIVGDTLHTGEADTLIRVDAGVTAEIAAQVTGDGGLTKDDGGTLVLSGANSYRGGTTIRTGTLSVSADANLGDATGTLVFQGGALRTTSDFTSARAMTVEADGSTMEVAVGTRFTMAGTITGPGSLIKTGAGTLALSGNSSYTGMTSLMGGMMFVNGTLNGTTVMAASGTTLGGSGSITGSVTIASGATLAPGVSHGAIGTLTIEGDFVSQGVLTIEATPESADRIVVAGQVDLTGSSLSIVELTASGWQQSTFFTIIDNGGAGAVDGTFTTVTNTLAFLDPEVDYSGGDGNDVVLPLVRNDVRFPDVAETRNQKASASVAEPLGSGHPIYDAILFLDAPGARSAFDALSGEIHASAKGVLLDESRYVRDAVTSRVRQSFSEQFSGAQRALAAGPSAAPVHSADETDRVAFWAQGLGSRGDTDSDGNAANLDHSTGHVLLGFDGGNGKNWRAGLAGGYSHTSIGVARRLSDASVGTYHLSAYGGSQLGTFGFRLGAAYAWHEVETSRIVAFPAFADGATASYDGGTRQLFAEVGYIARAGTVAVEPFAAIASVSVRTDGFRERGGLASLTASEAIEDLVFSTFGVRTAAERPIGRSMKLIPRATLGWRHAFGNVTPEARFILNSGADTPFTVGGAPLARDAFVVDAGLDLALGDNASVGFGYSGQIGSNARDHALRLNLTVAVF